MAQSDFGDPVGADTRVALCVYDGSDALVLDLRVDRAGELCGTKQKPCWKAQSTKGFAYKDSAGAADGVQKISEKAGTTGKGSVSVSGKNNAPKGLMGLPTGAAAALQGETSATLQVLTSDGECFEAGLTTVRRPPTGRASRRRRPSRPHPTSRGSAASRSPRTRRGGARARRGPAALRAGTFPR